MTVLALAFPLVLGACGDDDDDTAPTIDSAVPAIDGGAIDGGDEPAACATYASCTEFTDLTGMAEVTVAIADGVNAYDPKCIKVTAGTKVIVAQPTAHPFRSAECNETAITFTAVGEDDARTAEFTVDTPGVWGYDCSVHAAAGMRGAIEVVAAE